MKQCKTDTGLLHTMKVFIPWRSPTAKVFGERRQGISPLTKGVAVPAGIVEQFLYSTVELELK